MFRQDRGFTITELLIVLFITSIIGGVGLSSYKKTEKTKLLLSAKHIQSLIRVAQTRAYGQGNTHMVVFYPSLGKCIHVEGFNVTDYVLVGGNINLKPTNFPDNKLYFNGKLSPNQGGTIVLNSKSYEVKITVLPVTGRVKIYPVAKK